jgi:hypothetical protein
MNIQAEQWRNEIPLTTVNLQFKGQNSSVLPPYSPADMSILPRNSLVDMSCMCTLSVVLQT